MVQQHSYPIKGKAKTTFSLLWSLVVLVEEEVLRAPSENIVQGGSDPVIAVGGNKIFVTATRGGEGDIAITECTDNEDKCEEPESARS
jgi:hypothetical protein